MKEREDFAKIWQKKLYFMLYHSLQYAFGGTRSRGSTRVIWGPQNMGRWGPFPARPEGPKHMLQGVCLEWWQPLLVYHQFLVGSSI